MAVDINKLFLYINRVRLKDSPDTHFNYVAYLVSKRQGYIIYIVNNRRILLIVWW